MRPTREEIVTSLARSTPASRPQELLRTIGVDSYREAYEAGHNLSVELEMLDPSSDHPDTSLDAFGRLVRAAGIRTVSNEEVGLSAMPLSAFEANENARALVPELIARMYRRAATGRDPSTRGIYISTDGAPGTAVNPFAYAATPRFQQIAPAIPLSELVAFNTGIDSNIYKAYYLQTSVAETRMVRVAEAANVPRAKLVGGERSIQLYKYGRALEVSYETLRRMPIDLIAFHIARIAVQAEADKVLAVLDVAINGDGNANTSATVFNLTTLDPLAVAGTLSLKGWLAFKMLFENPYMITTALARSDVALQMQLLNVGSANVPLVTIGQASGFGGFTPINRGLSDNVALGWTADAPSLKIVGFDRRFAIERVFEIGANIQEVEKWTNRQVEILTMTETEGYDVFDQVATKILNVNA